MSIFRAPAVTKSLDRATNTFQPAVHRISIVSNDIFSESVIWTFDKQHLVDKIYECMRIHKK